MSNDDNANKTKNGAALSRRSLMKTAAVAGGAMAAGLPLINIARAASKTIKIGHSASLTGPSALFHQTSPWTEGKMKELLAHGLDVGGTKYDVEIITVDSQTNTNRAASNANQLILRENVDIVLIEDGISTPNFGELGDARGTPSIATMFQWEPFYAQRGSTPEKGFDYSFLFFSGLDKISAIYTSMWNKLNTNKHVGTLYVDIPPSKGLQDPNNGLSALMQKNGYKETAGGTYKMMADDFSNQIGKFKSDDCQIVSGLMLPPDFITFWAQSAQLGYNPEVVTVAAGFLFPDVIKALGDRGNGLSTEVWWTPNLPYKSSLTGQTARELATAWETEKGSQWTQPLGFVHAIWEIGIAALKNSGDPKDRKAVRDAIANMTMDTMAGKIDFKNSAYKSVSVCDLVGGQWRKTDGGAYPYELLITDNSTAPNIPVETELKLLSELARAR